MQLASIPDTSCPDARYLSPYSRAMMVRAGNPGFVWSDMTRPKSARLKRQLSALVNFQRFRIDRFVDFEDARAEGLELIAHRNELVKKVETLSPQVENEK